MAFHQSNTSHLTIGHQAHWLIHHQGLEIFILLLHQFIFLLGLNLLINLPEKIETKLVLQSGDCFILPDQDLTALHPVIDLDHTLGDIREDIIHTEEDMANTVPHLLLHHHLLHLIDIDTGRDIVPGLSLFGVILTINHINVLGLFLSPLRENK